MLHLTVCKVSDFIYYYYYYHCSKNCSKFTFLLLEIKTYEIVTFAKAKMNM